MTNKSHCYISPELTRKEKRVLRDSMNTVAQGKKSTEEYQYKVCKIIGIKWGNKQMSV